MPKGPKGEKRPADVVGNAVHVMRIATGEVEWSTEDVVALLDAREAPQAKRGPYKKAGRLISSPLEGPCGRLEQSLR